MSDSPPASFPVDEPEAVAQRPDDRLHESRSSDSRHPSRHLVFSVVSLALFMGAIDLTIVATALPAIQKNLHATINWSGWTITIYGLGLCVILPIAGKLSAHFGRRRIFICAIAVFSAASLACGLATDIYMLIVFRALQAIGGGALQPSAAGLISDHFGRDRDRGIAMFGNIISAGQILGPVLGGVLVTYLSWRWVFFVNVPIGIVLIAVVVRFIPESDLLERTRTDYRGLILMTAFILTAITGITDLGTGRTRLYDPLFLVPEVCAVVLLFLFVRHTNRAEAPFIPLRLLRGRGFAVINVINLILGTVAFGVASLIPLYAVNRYHLPVLSSGTLLSARGIGFIVTGTFATFALRRTGYRLPMIVGFTIVACGWLIASVAPRFGISAYEWLGMSSAITGLGFGAASPATRIAALQLAPQDVAAISGLRSMFNYLGIIFSVSISTAILNRSAHPGITQAHILWVVTAIIFFVEIPLVFRVPEHKGAW